MREVFVPREAWVLSGSMVGWGDEIVSLCEGVVFLTLDPAERLRRLEEREVRRRAGADYDELAWRKFQEWARRYDDPEFQGRSRAGHEAWLQRINLPVLRLDSSISCERLVEEVLAWEPEK